MTECLRVVLADDHELLLEGLRALLEAEPDMSVVATVSSGAQVLDAVGRHHPDLVVLDLEMSGLSGLACLKQLRDAQLPVRVLVLTAFGDGASMRAALEGGADGYALKTESPRHTIEVMREVARGHLVFPAAAKRWLFGRPGPDDAGQLTERERAVLELLAEGSTNAQIARRMHVSENTVKFHLQNLFLKLHVSNRTEAAAYYLKRVMTAPRSPR